MALKALALGFVALLMVPADGAELESCEMAEELEIHYAKFLQTGPLEFAQIEHCDPSTVACQVVVRQIRNRMREYMALDAPDSERRALYGVMDRLCDTQLSDLAQSFYEQSARMLAALNGRYPPEGG